MYFSTAVAFAMLPFLVGAFPVNNSRNGLSHIPLSKPSIRDANGHVDVESLQANINHTMAKHEQGFRAFEKNTGKPHPLASKQGDSNGRRSLSPVITVPLTDNSNTVWTGNLNVGSPPVTLNVQFDTGSGDLFLLGSSCSNCNGQAVFDPFKSSTAKDTNVAAFINFGSGELSCVIFMDEISLGGFQVNNQTLIVPSDTSGQNKQSPAVPAVGIMGMAFPEFSVVSGSTPFFQSVINNGGLGQFESVFGFFLEGGDSLLVLGGVDNNLFEGSLTNVNVDNQALWQIPFDSMSVNGNDISVSTKEAVIDTGTSLVLGNKGDIANIYSNIPGSAQMSNGLQWTIPCDTDVTITISFGGTAFFITSDTYNIGVVSGSTCMGGFSATPIDSVFWTLGDVFLRNVYANFDVGNSRVGFAQR